MNDNIELVEKSWNYVFFKGEEVIFNPDLEPFTNEYNRGISDIFDPKPYKGKIGVVVDCDSDLHAFKGSWYCCTVDFEGTLVKTFSGAFLTTY